MSNEPETAPKPSILRKEDLGPLQDLLLKACPPDPETGVKSIALLAKILKVNAFSIYKWIKAGHIPALRAQEIVDIANGEVSISDFSAFIYFKAC